MNLQNNFNSTRDSDTQSRPSANKISLKNELGNLLNVSVDKNLAKNSFKKKKFKNNPL